MTRHTLLAALLLAAGADARSQAGITAEAKAATWLRVHAGQPDELAELRNANPDAYAIVKSLLMKRQLGILNPRHPSAGFNEPAGGGGGAHAALAKMEADVSQHAALDVGAAQYTAPVEEAAASGGHRSWFDWKPSQDSGEGAEVQHVLGEASSLSSGGPTAEQALSAPVAPVPVELVTASAPVVEAAPVRAAATQTGAGSWSDILSTGLAADSKMAFRSPVAPAAPRAAPAAPDGGNPLLNFDWASAAPEQQPQQPKLAALADGSSTALADSSAVVSAAAAATGAAPDSAVQGNSALSKFLGS